MLSMNDIRKGKIILFEEEPYVVMGAEFLRKQQRRPVMRTILKHLSTGRTRNHTFHQADKVPEAAVEKRPLQFLYTEADRYVFMDSETYEQLELTAAMAGESNKYLLEGQIAEIVFFEGVPLAVELPIKIERRVIETAPGVRGDTAGSVMKEAVIEGGVRVRVPLFINEGDKVRIDTRDGSYVDRV
jgi:elongation factor P